MIDHLATLLAAEEHRQGAPYVADPGRLRPSPTGTSWLKVEPVGWRQRRRRPKERRRESHAQLQADIMRLELELGLSDEPVPLQINGILVASRPDPGQVERR